jgi:hypothetical protein
LNQVDVPIGAEHHEFALFDLAGIGPSLEPIPCRRMASFPCVVAPETHNRCASATKELAMYRIVFICVVATAFLGNGAIMPAFAQSTKLSKADQRLFKAAIQSCKSEAKTKKIKLLERRQYVIDCVQALKDRPQVNVQEVLKNHPDLKGLPCRPGLTC